MYLSALTKLGSLENWTRIGAFSGNADNSSLVLITFSMVNTFDMLIPNYKTSLISLTTDARFLLCSSTYNAASKNSLG